MILCKRFYNNGHTVKEIAEVSKLTPAMVRKYLRDTGFTGKFRKIPQSPVLKLKKDTIL